MLRRKLVPGENLNRAISASTWNDLLSLLDHRDRNGLWSPPRQVYGGDFERSAKACEVWVQNNSGYDLDQFAVCGIDTPLCDSSVATGEFKREVTFSVSTPGASPSGKFVVLKDAIPNGQCGKAVVAGATQARVDISDDTHEFCDAETGNLSTLVSGASGSAQILWKQQDSGDAVWCIVRLSNKAATGTAAPFCVLWDGYSINADGFGNLVYRSVGHGDNRHGFLFFDSAWGDMSSTKVEVLQAASDPPTWDDPMFRTTDGGLYRVDIGFHAVHTTPNPVYESPVVATTTVSGHSHNVTLRQETCWQQQITTWLEWRNAGGGAWSKTAPPGILSHYGDCVRMTSIDGDTSDYIYESITLTFFQNHNSANREYRIGNYLTGTWYNNPNEAEIVDRSAWTQITRLADYAADQTL